MEANRTKKQAATAGKTQNNSSGGTGRAPHEKEVAGARVGTTTATGAGGRGSNHSSRASDASRPAADTGRRPEVPAGVGPMINKQLGETRY